MLDARQNATEGVTTPSVCLPADTSLEEGGLLSDARQRATEGVTTPSVCLSADTSLEEGGLLSDARQRALSPFNALFFLKCAIRSSLPEGAGARQRD